VNDVMGYTALLAAAYGHLTPDEAAEAAADTFKRSRELKDSLTAYQKDYEARMSQEMGDVDREFQRFKGSFNEIRRGQVLTALKNFVGGGTMSVLELIDLIAEGTVKAPRGAVVTIAGQAANSALPVLAGTAGMIGGPIVSGIAAMAGSVPVEVGASMMEQLSARGVDITDPESLATALKDAKLMSEIRAAAERKGLTTSAFEGLFQA